MDSGIIFSAIIIVVSIMLSAFFSATETALTTINSLKTRHIISEKGAKAKALNLWLEKPHKLLNTIIFYNNLVNILASVLAANIAYLIFNSPTIVVTTCVMTFIILIFGEIIPKTFAKHNAESVAILNIRILKPFYYLAYPITSLMELLSTLMLKLMGKNKTSDTHMTEDELEFLINEGERVGVLEKGKGEMLTNIFDISDIQIKEVMVPRIDVDAISLDADKNELVELIRKSEFSRIPVYADSLDHIIGILYVKDIIRIMDKDFTMEDISRLLREPLFVPETKKIDSMLKEFQKSRLHFAVVVDEYGGTAGIVTMEDILEEIVGDIMDEYDEDDDEIAPIDEKRFLVDARINIDDFCEEFGIEKTEDMSEYETLGGFIFDISGEIPNIDDSFEWGDYRFTVKSMEDRKLERIEVEKIEREQCEDGASNE